MTGLEPTHSDCDPVDLALAQKIPFLVILVQFSDHTLNGWCFDLDKLGILSETQFPQL